MVNSFSRAANFWMIWSAVSPLGGGAGLRSVSPRCATAAADSAKTNKNVRKIGIEAIILRLLSIRLFMGVYTLDAKATTFVQARATLVTNIILGKRRNPLKINSSH